MSQDFKNPYKSPDFTDQPRAFGTGPAGGLSSSILTQQRVIAILLIIQGSLAIVVGLFFAVAAFAFPAMIAADMKRQGNLQFEQMQTVMLITYGGMALCGILPGLLQIYAGIQNLWLRGYTLGLVALGAGAFAVGTCYCFPTSIGLLIYGLVIYLNHTTKQAFELAKEGHTYDDILRMATNMQY